MRYEIRPLGAWTDPVTQNRRSSAVFKATWDDTLKLPGREVEQLGGDLIVVQVDVAEADLRRDGMLRTRAQVGFPGVRVSFDSKHGPLTYATDAYEQRHYSDMPSWQANVRAITLTLGALRDIDRWGVSKRGEQYRGWTAIPQRPHQMTREQAAEFIAHWSGLVVTAQAILRDPQTRAAAYRAAARRAHPDITKDDGDTMARLNAARDLLERRRG